MLATLPAIALLLTAILLGGMSLFAFGFAIFALRNLPTDVARSLIRKAFPPYYLLVIVISALTGMAALPNDRLSATLLAAICGATVIARQVVMPAVNAATDRGDRGSFGILHGVSVLIQIAQIIATAIVLLRF
jgi:hypothetical protein